MAGIDVGGDSSVEWLVLVDNVRTTPNGPEHGPNPNKPAGWRHHGVDETDTSVPRNFTICIRIPNTRQAFFTDLQNAITRDSPNSPTLCFPLPIVQGQPQQIRIEWDSKPLAPGKKKDALASMLARVKRGRSLVMLPVTGGAKKKTVVKPPARKKSGTKKKSGR